MDISQLSKMVRGHLGSTVMATALPEVAAPALPEMAVSALV